MAMAVYGRRVSVSGCPDGRSDGSPENGGSCDVRRLPRRAVLAGVAVGAVGAGGIVAAAPAAANGSFPTSPWVAPQDFGAIGDGEANDTAALQSWLTHVVTNHKRGWLPNGTYKITDTLIAPPGIGWSIVGESQDYALIKQFTDNIPVLQLGTAEASSHSYSLESLIFTYAAAQPSTNTNANFIDFRNPLGGTGSTYYCSFKQLQFYKGFYAFKYPVNAYGPWGCVWDQLYMSDMSGGLLDCTGSLSSAANNTWGRVTMNCVGAVGPIFNNWACYNTSVGVLEFINADQGPQLINTGNAFSADIGAIKLEIGAYSGAGFGLINFTGDYYARIGNLHIGPGIFTPSAGVLSAISAGGGASSDSSFLEINTMVLATEVGEGYEEGYGDLSGTVVALSGGGPPNRRISVNTLQMSGGWTLQSTASTETGNYVTVRSWVSGAASLESGAADYVALPGTSNIIYFNSPFASPRTVTLPAQNGNNLFAGLYYEIVFDGAINGSNTATIKQGDTVMRTQTLDGKKLSYVWRRGSDGGEWVLNGVTDIGSLPEASAVPASSNDDVAMALAELIADLKTRGIIPT